jgi:hypothetical protein
VTAFLAENYTHFMLEEAMDEAAEAAAALSDAGEWGCDGGVGVLPAGWSKLLAQAAY